MAAGQPLMATKDKRQELKEIISQIVTSEMKLGIGDKEFQRMKQLVFQRLSKLNSCTVENDNIVLIETHHEITVKIYWF